MIFWCIWVVVPDNSFQACKNASLSHFHAFIFFMSITYFLRREGPVMLLKLKVHGTSSALK